MFITPDALLDLTCHDPAKRNKCLDMFPRCVLVLRPSVTFDNCRTVIVPTRPCKHLPTSLRKRTSCTGTYLSLSLIFVEGENETVHLRSLLR